MKKTALTLCLALLTGGLHAQQAPIEKPLWNTLPDSNGLSGPEKIDEKGFITNISSPAITVYPADDAKNTGMAVLIAPGGGYGAEASWHEGRDFATWLAENGVAGVVLKYRLPNRHRLIPLEDAQQAMRVIRSNAADWGIDPSKVGVMGSSAGGHLASTLLTHFDEGSRPDFGVLVYPVVTFIDSLTHRGTVRSLLGENPSQELRDYYSNEKQVTPQTPPTLIFFSDADKTVDPRNGTLFYEALRANGVPGALYLFPNGWHGWGFREQFPYHETMKMLYLDFLNGLFKEKNN